VACHVQFIATCARTRFFIRRVRVAETVAEGSQGGFWRKSGHIRTSAHHHESEAAFPINRREARAAVSLFARVFFRPNPFPEPDRELSSLAAVVSSFLSLAPTLPASTPSFFECYQELGPQSLNHRPAFLTMATKDGPAR
jgi:hypothetical protein